MAGGDLFAQEGIRGIGLRKRNEHGESALETPQRGVGIAVIGMLTPEIEMAARERLANSRVLRDRDRELLPDRDGILVALGPCRHLPEPEVRLSAPAVTVRLDT